MKQMNYLNKFVAIFLFLGSVMAQAEDTSSKICMNPELVKYALSEYQIQDVDDDGKIIKQYSEEDSCDTGLFRNTVLALDFLRKTPKKQIPPKLQTLVNQEGPIEFLKKRIKIIALEQPTNSSCNRFTGAFVWNKEIDKNIMHVCPALKGASPILFASSLVHEARHIDGFKHVDCTHGIFQDLDGSGACDNTYKEQGSYGIGLAYSFQVYYGTKNEEVKQSARNSIIIDSLNHFNTAPLGLTKGGIFLDEQNNLSFYDGSQESQLVTFTDDTAALTLRSGLPTVFFKNGQVTMYDFTRTWGLRQGAMVDNYNKLSESERNDLLDIYGSSKEYCFLLPSLIKCMDADFNFVSMSLPTINPTRFWDTYRLNKSDIRVLGGDGKIYYLPDSILFKETSEKDAVNEKNIFHYPEVTSYVETTSGRIMGITPQGRMVAKKNKDAPWVPAKEFGDYKFKKIVPYYWSQKLEDL